MIWYLFIYIVFIRYYIIDNNTWLCINFFLQTNECIKVTFGLYIDTWKVWISLTLSLFDVFKWFYSLLFICELTVEHLVFLKMLKIFLPCFFLYNLDTTNIYFNFVKYFFNTIKIVLDNWEYVQWNEHWESNECVISIIIYSMV